VFAVFFGVRSFSGYETDAQHLHGGKKVTVTCDAKGNPTGGMGFLTSSATEACSDAHDDQRGHAPLWIFIGLAVTLYGVSKFRKVRAASG
jgi:hypothetical protein